MNQQFLPQAIRVWVLPLAICLALGSSFSLHASDDWCSVPFTFSKTDATCFGGSDGSITLSPTGGTAPYQYQWSNGGSTASISGLSSGNYGFTITDADGCSESSSIFVGQPFLILGNYTKDDLECHGASDGSATLNPSGGTPPYTYAWSNGETTASIAGLTAGEYSFTVTDSQGCTGDGVFSITEPTPLLSYFTQQYVSAPGADDGSVTAIGYGGTPPYSYSWSTGDTGPTISNLPPGMYSYSITDANGCEGRGGLACIIVGNIPTDLEATPSVPLPSCEGADNGSVSLIVSGGTPPYEYLWSNGATTSSVSNLAPGTYSYAVMDADGQGVTGEVTIAEVPSPTCLIEVDDATGDLSVQVSGGTAPYSYLWSTGATTSNLSGLDEGFYEVTVTDANGCVTVCGASIDCPNVETPGMIGEDQYLCGPGNDPDPIISLAGPTGGTGTIEYLWMFTEIPGQEDFIQFWTPIPNSNSPSYDPGPLDVTTYFARCVRIEGCVFLESNVVTITVGNEASGELILPELGCILQDNTFAVVTSTGNAQVNWTFDGPTDTPTATGQQVEVYLTLPGILNITAEITENGCTAYVSGQILVGTNPDLCGPIPVGGYTPHYSPVEGENSSNLFPNPSTGLSTLRLPREMEAQTLVQVVDVHQRVVEETLILPGERQLDLNLTSAPAGLYFVKIRFADGNTELLRWVKQ